MPSPWPVTAMSRAFAAVALLACLSVASARMLLQVTRSGCAPLPTVCREGGGRIALSELLRAPAPRWPLLGDASEPDASGSAGDNWFAASRLSPVPLLPLGDGGATPQQPEA